MDSDLSHEALNRFNRLEQAVSRLFHNGGVKREEDESVADHIDRATAEDVSVNPPAPEPTVATQVPTTETVPSEGNAVPAPDKPEVV